MDYKEYLFLLPDFQYDGTAFTPEVWKTDGEEIVSEDAFRRITRRFISPDGRAMLTATARIYKNYPAVELRPELTVTGPDATGIFSEVMTFSKAFAATSPETAVRAVLGSQCKPTDFCSRRFLLADRDLQRDLKLETPEGRSSAEWMPYVGVDFDPLHGLELAIGWSGWWQASFQRTGSELKVSAGLGHSHFRMRPGEHFQLPSALIFHRDGIREAEFQSVIHDFMVRIKAPRDSRRKIIRPRLPIGAGGGNKPPELMRKIIGYAAENRMPFDTFWIDAGGWGPAHTPEMKSNCGDCWLKYAGWWTVNPTVHPDRNFKKVSDAAKAAGMDLLLWFEPERVSENAPVLREHPDYVYPSKIRWEFAHLDQYLLDLGNPEARQWIFDLICKNIDESGVGIYRQDMNLFPKSVWARTDAPDRIGTAEIRHINGLYIFWDMLRKRYPDLLLENCASGGRRLDYEAMSRCHAYCYSDYVIPRKEECHPFQILQGQNARVNTMAWVPFQANEANPTHTFDDYELFSLAGTGIVFTPSDWEGGIIDREFSEKETAWFRKSFETVGRMRDLLTGGFRPLTPGTDLGTAVWAAWQGHDPETDRGFIIAFRREDAPEETKVFSPGWIDPAGRYKICGHNEEKSSMVSGKELEKVRISLPPRSFRLFFYEKVN